MTHLAMALLMMLLGYLVKFRRWSWMIAGYNTSSPKEKNAYDIEALCSGVGHFLFVLAGILGFAFLGEWLEIPWLGAVSWAGFVGATVVFLIYANTGNRYRK